MTLKLENISVFYDKVEAVRSLSMLVPDNKIVTIIGANGAGKTTILNAISGIVGISSGEVWFDGNRTDRLTAAKIVDAGIGHVPEGRRIFPFMTVYENIKIGAFHRKWDNEVEEDIEEIYVKFPILKDRSKQKAGNLSGGEQQMLAIARALMQRPKILLMDEPSMGLAPLVVERIVQIISEIKRQGVSVLLVEQNAKMALGLADYGYVLEVGEKVLEGDGESLQNDKRIKAAYLGG